MVDELFPGGPRTDFAARSFNEPHYDFLNRSGDPFIEDIRRLIARWLSRMPSMHIADLQYRLQSKDDAEFESAFWELYLHEAYRRSGYRLTIHPAVPGTTRHPDFLVEDDGTRFYLEAVRACASASNTGENKRLEDARRVLAELRADRYMLDMASYVIGARPLKVKVLRRDLREWLADLDRKANPYPAGTGSRTLPRLSWRQEDGWRLEFTAQLLRPEHIGTGLPLIRAHLTVGWGHDAARILAALDEKANKYGPLEAPLVIAVLSNAQFRTEDIDVERALFGALTRRPSPQRPEAHQLLEPGHWCTGKGWRRAHAPQVIAVHDLYPWTITKAQPRLWTTLQPSVAAPAQPGWLAVMRASSTMPTPAAADSVADLFGLPPGWSAREPHFVTQPRTVPL